MKQFFSLALATLMAAPSFAQQAGANQIPQVPTELKTPKLRALHNAMDGSERPSTPLNEGHSLGVTHDAIRALVVEREVIGLTQYDLQTNAAIDNRVAGTGNEVSAVFTMSVDASPFEDRGTG